MYPTGDLAASKATWSELLGLNPYFDDCHERLTAGGASPKFGIIETLHFKAT